MVRRAACGRAANLGALFRCVNCFNQNIFPLTDCTVTTMTQKTVQQGGTHILEIVRIGCRIFVLSAARNFPLLQVKIAMIIMIVIALTGNLPG